MSYEHVELVELRYERGELVEQCIRAWRADRAMRYEHVELVEQRYERGELVEQCVMSMAS